ncbi:MAG: sensor histidine kinase [Chitinophagaceae bacterium]
MKKLPEVFTDELIRGLQFSFIAFSYRFFFDWAIIERIKRTLENQKLKAELKSLRHQLNPHFLFNTINDIYYLAIIKSDKTPDALLKLTDLLRYVLDEKEDLVPLSKEIYHLQKFVELHHLRFPDEVIDLNVDPAVLASSLEIPPMILSTFVENAFKHGQPGTPEDPILIDIKISESKLIYRVENKIKPDKYKDETSGIGMPNLLKRLHLLYPGKYTISYKKIDSKYIAYLEIQLNS